jgi:NADH-quinone oxidoreductase subunit C
VTDSPPDTDPVDADPVDADQVDADETEIAESGFAAELAELVGATSWVDEFETVRIYVAREHWVESLRLARDDAGLTFFAWLSAIDWSTQVAVGEQVADPEELIDRYEVICRLSSVTSSRGAHFLTEVPKDDAVIDSVVPLFGGAEWHEREAAEMFGITFRGHPNPLKLYLPDLFQGYPLRKSYPLLSREVKPWPGTVDVEAMPAADGPSTTNVEAGDTGGGE